MVIPPDWQTRIANGQDVPGCTYARIEADGTLTVSDTVQAGLAIPADVQAIPVTAVSDLEAAVVIASGTESSGVVKVGSQDVSRLNEVKS